MDAKDKGKGPALLPATQSSPVKLESSPVDNASSSSLVRESTVDSLHSQSSQHGSYHARFGAALLAARSYVMPLGECVLRRSVERRDDG